MLNNVQEETIQLTEKWCEAARESMQDLKSLTEQGSSQEVTMKQMLEAFRVDPALLQFDEESDDFLV